MDIFRTPGSTLLGNDKIQFDNVKELIEKGTSDFLIKADWDSNIACVDKINSLIGSNTLPDVIFLLRRKLGVREARQVVLTLQLIESLVKNCGTRFHNAINEDKFMKEMANVTRRFVGKSAEGCREATDLSLDLIQAWGEAFLPKQNQYPFIVKTYFELRKDGTQFKKQFDPDRMPILTEGIARPSHHNPHTDADAMLAATMQLELNTSAKSIPDSLTSVSEDEFSRSFFNSSVYQGHESGKMSGSPQRTVQKRPTPQHKPAAQKKEAQRKDSFDPSMYPDYDFGDSKPSAAVAHHHRPAPTSKQNSIKDAKRDSFDPSQYPDYDFSDVGHASKPVHHKVAAPLNKRSSFDPSQYPDHNFNDDSRPHAQKASADDSVTANEVIQSFTFSLSILKDLILACTHERELRGNEVALEVVQQVAAMEGKMNDFIEHALVHESDRVEQLFALNEDAQTLLNVFNMLVASKMTLAVGKGKLGKISLILKDSAPSHAAPAKNNAPLIDFEEHKSHHPPQQQQHAQDTHHNHPSVPNRENVMQVAHQQNSQRQQTPVSQTIVRPPMINTTSTSKPAAFKLAPPPRVDSIYGKDLKADTDIIELDADCMTSPQALDALFEDPAVLKARGTPLGIHIAHPHGATEPAKFDPFSPDALDALFDKPVQKSTPRVHVAQSTPKAASTPTAAAAGQGAKFDPFSPDALDALFDTPPAPAPHPNSGQTPRHYVSPPLPSHPHYSQNGAHQNDHTAPHPQYAQPHHQQYVTQQYQHPPVHYATPPPLGQQSDPYQYYPPQQQQHSGPQTPRNQSPAGGHLSAPHGQQQDLRYAVAYQQQQQHLAAAQASRGQQQYVPHQQQQSRPALDPHHSASVQQHPPHYPPQQYGAPQSQYPPPQNGYDGYPPVQYQQQQQQYPPQQQTGYGSAPYVGQYKPGAPVDSVNPFDTYYENN